MRIQCSGAIEQQPIVRGERREEKDLQFRGSDLESIGIEFNYPIINFFYQIIVENRRKRSQ
jgi:hypothetical protein